MNACAFVLMNNNTGILFLAYPLYFRFPVEQTVESYKVGVFFEMDKPDAYAVQFEDELMLINAEIYQRKIDEGAAEVLGNL